MSNPYPWALPGDGSIEAIRTQHAEHLRLIEDKSPGLPNPYIVALVAVLLAEIDRLAASHDRTARRTG
jgi:hypothetical protein